jgi:uncharacterized protein YodC (DUF2158 family)
MDYEFEIGNVVRMLSGGPLMTITDISEDGFISLAWYDRSVLGSGDVRETTIAPHTANALVLIEDESDEDEDEEEYEDDYEDEDEDYDDADEE